MIQGRKVVRKRRLHIVVILVCALSFGVCQPVFATSSTEIQEELDQIQKDKDKLKQEQSGNQSKLEGTRGKINNLTGVMDDLDAEIEGLDTEMVGLLTDISIIEQAIQDKREEIAQTEEALKEAIQVQDEQYEAMKIRIRYMYEKGDKSYLTLLLESQSIDDALNKADYIEKLYEYDRKLLLEYQATVQRVSELKDTLEEEESELMSSKIELREQQELLDELLAQKKKEYEDYDARLVKAKQEAAVYTAKINQQTNELRALEAKQKEKEKEKEEKLKEEEEAKRKAEEAKRKAEEERLRAEQEENGNSPSAPEDSETSSESSPSVSSDDSSSSGHSEPPSSSGSSNAPKPSGGGGSKGQQIVDYACQFLGNPYVPGGTSLTNGADCSGFTLSVFKQFGINLPRSSYAQSQVGTAVSYDQARAGDIIYYGGHVGIYMGDGRIVHASTQKTGIKISVATYRPIITIRRVIN